MEQTQDDQVTPPKPLHEAVDPYFRRLTARETFSFAANILFQRYPLFLSITTFCYVMGWVVTILAAWLLNANLERAGFLASFNSTLSTMFERDKDDAGGYSDHISKTMEPWQMEVYALECFLYFVLLCISSGAIIFVTANVYLKERMSGFQAFCKAAWRGMLLITSCLIQLFLMALPLILFVIIAMIKDPRTWPEGFLAAAVIGTFIGLLVWSPLVMVVFVHSFAAIMVEQLGVIPSLRRSYSLSKGERGYLFTTLMRMRALLLYASLAVGTLGAQGAGWWWFSKALAAILFITLAAFESILQAVVYFRNRIQKECLGRIQLALELGKDVLGMPVEENSTNYVAMDPLNFRSPAFSGVMA